MPRGSLLVYLLDDRGVKTGLSSDGVKQTSSGVRLVCVHIIEQILPTSLPTKIQRLEGVRRSLARKEPSKTERGLGQNTVFGKYIKKSASRNASYTISKPSAWKRASSI